MTGTHARGWGGRRAVGLVLLLLAVTAPAAEVPASQRVLLLFSEGKDLPVNVILERAAKAELAARSRQRLEFYAEHLDASRFPGESYYKLFCEYLREKYVSRNPDLVVAFLAQGFGLAGQLPAEVFPGVPVVFVSLNEAEVPERLRLPRSTGLIQRFDFRGTFELILTAQPGTRRIVVIGGVAPLDQQFIQRAKEVAANFSARVPFEFWTDRAVADLPAAIGALPKDTVVCLSTVLRDAAGQNHYPAEVIGVLAPKVPVPVYVFSDSLFGSGAVGGALVDFDELGRRAGEFGLRILGGTPPAELPIEVRDRGAPTFDWRALERWGINEQRLPADSRVRYRPPSLWADHQGLILTTSGVIVAQMLTIAGLLAHRRHRRRSEAALRESEERMNLAADAANLGMWVWDVGRDEFWATVKCRALFGFTPDERVDFAAFIARVLPEDRAKVERATRRALEARGIFDEEYRVCLPDGGIRWIAARGVAAGPEQGTRMLGVCVDLTDKKQAEIEIQRQRTELAHVARVSMMGELSTSVAHELNQPLAAILTNADAAELFLNRNPPALDQVRSILADIRQDDERAGEVIRHMRALLHRRELERHPLAINSVVEDVLRMVGGDAAQRKTTLAAALSPDLPPVAGDRIHLQQVLLNLVMNAMDAVAKQAPAARRVVVHTGRRADDTIEVSVTDSGAGIDSAALAHLFEPFFTTKPNGLGMGLSISRRIIEAHQGRIWAENVPTGGATFRFTLPVASGEK